MTDVVQLIDTAQKAARRISAIAQRPIGFDDTTDAARVLGVLRSIGPSFAQALRADLGQPVLSQTGYGSFALKGCTSLGTIEASLHAGTSQIVVRHMSDPMLDVSLSMDVSSEPGLPYDLRVALTRTAALATSTSDPSHGAAALETARTIVDAVRSAFADMIDHLLDDGLRARSDVRAGRAHEAMRACAAMVEAVRPGLLTDLVADTARGAVSANLGTSKAFAMTGLAPVPFDLPVPDHIRDAIAGEPLCAATVDGFVENDAQGHALHRMAIHVASAVTRPVASESPADAARLVRAFGTDGTEIAAAVDAAIEKAAAWM